MADDIFAVWAPVYRDRGYWPRPIWPGSKACRTSRWQTPDSSVANSVLESWLTKYGGHGIGLLLGSPFPDGTVLGALDIDHDGYSRVARVLLFEPPCGRVGARGVMYFVRIKGDVSYREFKIKGEGERIKVGELLVSKRLAVVPPTVHPDTKAPYRWVGQPLHETTWTDLPIVEV